MFDKFWLKYSFSYILDLFVGSMFGVIDVFLAFIAIGGLGNERVDYFCDYIKRIILSEGLSPLILVFFLMQILFFAEQFFFTPSLNKLYDKILSEANYYLSGAYKFISADLLKEYDAESLKKSVEKSEFFISAREVFSDIEQDTDKIIDKCLFDEIYKKTEDATSDKIDELCREICDKLHIDGGETFMKKLKKEITAYAAAELIEKILHP